MTMRFEKKYRIGQRGAVYEFDVKLGMKVRGVDVSDRDLEVDTRMAVEELEDTLRQEFRWIGKVYLTGRSGGWLAIEDKTGGATKGALEIIGEMIDTARERFEADLVQGYGYEKGFQPNAISAKLRKAYDFFKEQGGGVVGRAGESALHLARAEQYADDHGWEAIWEDDPEEYELGDAETERPLEVLTCVLRDENGVVLGSLGSIGMSGNVRQDRDYRRVVEAELALDAMPARLTPGPKRDIQVFSSEQIERAGRRRDLEPNRLPRYDYVDELRQKPLPRLRSMQSVTEQQIARAVSRGNTRALEELQTRQREIDAAIMQKEFGKDSALRPNGAPEPRRFVTGSGPWWTYYETGSFQRGDKAVHIHRVASQALARIRAQSLQREHGGFVTVVHGGREVDTVGPKRASWNP